MSSRLNKTRTTTFDERKISPRTLSSDLKIKTQTFEKSVYTPRLRLDIGIKNEIQPSKRAHRDFLIIRNTARNYFKLPAQRHNLPRASAVPLVAILPSFFKKKLLFLKTGR